MSLATTNQTYGCHTKDAGRFSYTQAAPQSLSVYGATGANANVINGTYDICGERKDKPSWQKRGREKSWLSALNNKWFIGDSATRVATRFKVFAESSDAVSPLFAITWEVWNGITREHQSLIVSEARNETSMPRHIETKSQGDGALTSTPTACQTNTKTTIQKEVRSSKYDASSRDRNAMYASADSECSIRDSTHQAAQLQYSVEELAQLRQMVHPLFGLMPPPLDATSDGTFKHVHVSAPSSSCTLADSIKCRAEEIAKNLKDAKQIHLACCDDVLPDFLLAVVSIGMFLAGIEEPPNFELSIASSAHCQKVREAWERWRKFAKQYSTQRLGQGDWISSDNSPHCRLVRQAAAVGTLFKGFNIPSRRRSIQETCFVFPREACATHASQRCRPERIRKASCFALDVAVAQPQPKRVAVVNAASSRQIGGGFFSGGRHALEEALCTQSTLIFSLLEASRRAKRETWGLCHSIHIPENGAVLSPHVEVIRKGTAEGYESIQPVELAAVLSIAMPNRNPCVRNNPTYHGSATEYEHLIEQKFKAVLEGADKVGAQVLIIPDVGCGVFKNDPRVVGKILGSVLASDVRISEVILVGSDEFYTAAVSESKRQR